MLAMFGKWIERVKRNGKNSADAGLLGQYLDAVCTKYVDRYKEMIGLDDKRPGTYDSALDVDALDVLAQLVMAEMGIPNADLAAARAYLSILIENEHLPLQNQLNADELGALRDLLFSYFGGSDAVNDRGAEVLELIEHKFTSGCFSQAKILLQIFETNHETRQNNERNLYYEEMIMRIDGVRSANVSGISKELVDAACADDAPDEAILAAFDACASNANIHFDLFLRDLNEEARWKDAIAPLPQNVQNYILEYVPVVRWRQLGTLKEPLINQINRHMVFESLRRYVQQKLRMCYFILLASGITGYEWFIYAFTNWSRDIFNVDVREIFPVLHRLALVDGMCLQEVLDVTLERYYGPAMNDIVLDAYELDKAFRESVRFILQTDMSMFPMGYYNFGDFLLDRILPFPYEDPYFACRLHLLM